MNCAAKAAAQESSGSSAWTSIMAAELQLPYVFIYRCRLRQPKQALTVTLGFLSYLNSSAGMTSSHTGPPSSVG